MPSRRKKLEAIFNFGLMVADNPWLAFLIGFLAGQVDRVNFVEDLRDAEIAVKISTRQSAVWPSEPFKANVRGVTMPNTYTFVRAIENDSAPICVRLDFERRDETPWYQGVALPSAAYVKGVTEASQEESEALWREMDHTLDIYRQCRDLLKNGDPGRKAELQYIMKTAESEMKKLSREMEELNRHMKRISEAESSER